LVPLLGVIAIDLLPGLTVHVAEDLLIPGGPLGEVHPPIMAGHSLG
jgi:hypothetical protein